MKGPATRVALVVIGCALAVFGMLTLVQDDQVWTVLPWAIGPVIVHDAIIAPIVVAVSWFASCTLPVSVRTPVLVGLVITGCLVVVAIPVLSGAGALPDNPTLLDRNYVAGLAAALAVLWAGVGVAAMTSHRRVRNTGQHG